MLLFHTLQCISQRRLTKHHLVYYLTNNIGLKLSIDQIQDSARLTKLPQRMSLITFENTSQQKLTPEQREDLFGKMATSVVILIGEPNTLSTGVMISKKMILTCAHCIKITEPVFQTHSDYVQHPRRLMNFKSAIVEKRCESTDLCLLRATEGTDNDYIELSDDGASISQEVYSIGHSHELYYGKNFGIVSQKGPCGNFMDPKFKKQRDQVIIDPSVPILLVKDPTIGSAGSGGPIFNSNGRLVGIVKGSFRGTGQAVVISSEAIKEFLGDQVLD